MTKAYILLMDSMALPEHVRKLREDIAQIRKQNEEYLRFQHHSKVEIYDHRERKHRLEEIMRELADLIKRRNGPTKPMAL